MSELVRLGLVVEADGFVRADRAMADFNRTAGNTEKSATNLASAIKAIVGVMSVKQVADYADRWSDLNSRLVNATGSQAAADVAMRGLSQTARTTYSALEATADSFLRNSMTMKELGYSTREQINLSDALNNSLVISGTKGQAAESVMNALSKSLALGKLSGDNFNTVIQSGGRTVQALANGLGVATSELRGMADAGELKTGVVIDALTSQMEKLREEAAAMPATVGDGFTLMGNALLEFVGRADQTLGATEAVSAGMIAVADSVNEVARDAAKLESVLGTAVNVAEALAVVVGVRMVGALGKSTAAIVANIAATATATTTTNVWSQRTVTATAAQNLMTASTARMGAAMKVMGGPVSVVALAAGAIYLWAKSASDARQPTIDLTQNVDTLAASYESLGSAQKELANQDVAIKLAENADSIATTQRQIDALRTNSGLADPFGFYDDADQKILEARAELEKLRQEEQRLLEVRKAFAGLNFVGPLQEFTEEAKASGAATDAASDKLDEYIKSLQNDQKALGMTAREQAMFTAELKALSLDAGPEAIKTVRELAAANYDIEASAEAAAAAHKELTKEYEDAVKAINDETAAIKKSTEQARFETQAIGKTAAEISALELARFDNVTVMQQEQLAMLDSIGVCTAETEALRASIQARKEYRAAMVDQSAVQARQSQIEAEEKAMVDMWAKIDDAARDAFVSIADGGRDAFERLEDSLKSGLYALLYEMTVKKWVINIAANVSGDSTAQQAFGSTGTSDILSSALGSYGRGKMAGMTKSGAVITDAEYQQLMGGKSTKTGINMTDVKGAAMNIGAGIAGSYSGNAVGEALFKKEAESAWGATIGGTIGSMWGPIGSFIGSALGGLVDVAVGGDGKVRQNAGFLVGDTPGLKDEYNAGSHTFASGIEATLFARRASASDARNVLEVFDQTDRAFADFVAALGGKIGATGMVGLDEEATPGSTGALFGFGGNGVTQGNLLEQVNSWVGHLAKNVTGLDGALLASIQSATTAEETLSLLAAAVAKKAAQDKDYAESIGVAQKALEPLAKNLLSLQKNLQSDIHAITGPGAGSSSIEREIGRLTDLRQTYLSSHEQIVRSEQDLHNLRKASSQSLWDYAQSLRYSGLNTGQQFDVTKSAYERAIESALSGNYEDVDKLQGYAEQYLAMAKDQLRGSDLNALIKDVALGLEKVSVRVDPKGDYDPKRANDQLLTQLTGVNRQLEAIPQHFADKLEPVVRELVMQILSKPDDEVGLKGAIDGLTRAVTQSSRGREVT